MVLTRPYLPEDCTDILDVRVFDDKVVLMSPVPVVVAPTDVVILLPSDVFSLLRETEADIIVEALATVVTEADKFVKVPLKSLALTEADVATVVMATVVMPTVALAAVCGVDA